MFLKILFICLFFIFATAAVYALVRFYNVILKTDKDMDIIQEDMEKSPVIVKEDVSMMKAAVLCSPNKTFDFKKFDYKGQKDCFLFKKLYDSAVLCSVQCFGFGSCRSFCPENAIIIKNNTALVTNLCIGCGKCIEHCPTNCIKLFPLENYPSEKTYEFCANDDFSCKNCSVCRNRAELSGETIAEVEK